MKAVLSMYVLDKLTHIEDNMPDWGQQTAHELSPEFSKAVYWVETEWSGDSVTWTYPWETNGGEFNNRKLARCDNKTVKVWDEFDLTDAVKMLVDGTHPNYGFFVWPLTASLQDNYGVTYASSEYADQTLRPKLTITTDGTGATFDKSAVKNNVLKVFKRGYSIQNPFNKSGRVSVTDLHGREILVIEDVEANGTVSLSENVSEGVYVVGVQAGSDKVVERVGLVR